MWSLLCLLVAVSLPAVFSHDDLNEDVIIRGRYEDLEKDWRTNEFRVERINSIGVHAIHNAEIFEEGGNWYIGTSEYDDELTLRGPFPIFGWDDEEEMFEEVSTHPQIRLDTLDYGSSVTYFTTADGQRWAYDALTVIENNTLRSRAEISYTGNSYIYQWNGNGWDDTPALTYLTYGATTMSGYFQAPDEREYLFTYSWGNDTYNRDQGADYCILIEYANDGWTVVDQDFVACPGAPATPLVFTNINGEWVYLSTSFGSVTRNGNTFGDINTQNAPQVWWNFRSTAISGLTTPSNRFELGEYMDNFNVPNAMDFWHWQEDGFDHIVILTADGVVTKRLWWETHYVEDLPMVQTEQAANNLEWLDIGEKHCFVLSYPGYNGRDNFKPTVYDHWIPVWCWDNAHDNWDIAIKIPAEGAWWVGSFVIEEEDEEDNRLYIVTLQDAHAQMSSMVVYRVIPEDDIDQHIWFDFWTASAVHLDLDELKDKLHDNMALSITVLCLCIVTFFNCLILLFTSKSGGGGGGGDYKAYA